MSWFMDHAVLFALLCAGAAVVYGLVPHRLAAAAAGRQRADAGDRARRAGGRRRVPAPPVPDDRGRRDRAVPPARLLPLARLGDGDRLPHRRGPVGRRRLHRDERRRALERADGGGGPPWAAACAQRRLPRRIRHGPHGGRARPVRRRRLLRDPHRLDRRHSAPGDPAPRRPRLRRLAHLRLRAARRRHLHEGRGRRRRPRRQDRGGDPGGRPAQPGRDRGQRRRQRRRLRRHGRRPVRDVRGDRGRRDAARRHRSPRFSPAASSGSIRSASAASRSSPRSSASSSRASARAATS